MGLRPAMRAGISVLLLIAGPLGCAPAVQDWSSVAKPPPFWPDIMVPGVTEAVLARRPPPAQSDGFSLCEAAVLAAEAREQTPAGLLSAIARVESGRPDPHTHVIRPWPWSIDVDGQSRFFPDREQAIAGVRAAQAGGATSIDVGCMQVNLQYHPNAFRSLQEAFDPSINAFYAARFLKSLWAATPNHEWMVAAGYYHSHTPDLAANYRRQVQGFGGKPCPLQVPHEGSLILRAPDPLRVATGTVLSPPSLPPPALCEAVHRS